MNREPININAGDEQQDKYIKGNDTHKDSLSFPIGSIEAMKREDGGSWKHCIIAEANNTDHNG